MITKDAQPLVWHDPTIDPTKCADTGPAFPGDPQYPYVGKLVHDLTLAQIRTLDCGKLLNNFPDAEVVPNNKIATLPEVFALADSYRPRSATTSKPRSRRRSPKHLPAHRNSSM